MENRAKSFTYPKRNEITVISGIKIFNHKPEGQRYYYFCCEVNISLISSKKEYYRCRYNSTRDQFNFNHDHVFTVKITDEKYDGKKVVMTIQAKNDCALNELVVDEYIYESQDIDNAAYTMTTKKYSLDFENEKMITITYNLQGYPIRGGLVRYKIHATNANNLKSELLIKDFAI